MLSCTIFTRWEVYLHLHYTWLKKIRERPSTTTPLVFHHPQFGACHSNSVLSPGCLGYGHLFCQLDWWNLWSQDKDDDWMLVNSATALQETKAGPTSLQLKAPDGNFRNAKLWLHAAPSEVSRKATGNSSTDLSTEYFAISHSQCREGWGRRQSWRWHQWSLSSACARNQRSTDIPSSDPVFSALL